MSTKKPIADHSKILLRIPDETLAQVEEFTEKKKEKHRYVSRNSAILLLIERGLGDVSRRMRA